MATTTNGRVRRPASAIALAVGGAVLRLAVVVAALAVPAFVVWEQRAVVEPVFAVQTVAQAPSAEGWATVMLGAPSQTPPRPRPVEVLPAALPIQSTDSRGSGSAAHVLVDSLETRGDATQADRRATNTQVPVPVPEPPTLPPDFEVVVAKGVTLGEISQTYYNTSRPRWVAALAAYNGLADANKVRLGQKLRVPHRDKLGLD